MIDRVTEQWQKVEANLHGEAGGEREGLEKILTEIVGVRDVLKRMCQVSVTRTTLKEAVREALLPVIREHRDELFPELAELRRRLVVAGEDPESLAILAGGAPAELGEVQSRLEEFEARLGRLWEDLEGTRSAGFALEHKLEKVEESFERLEASVPEAAARAAGEAEERLRKEIADMVEQLTAKLGELEGMLGQIRDRVPDRQLVEALDRRLERLESCFSQVAERVGNIDAVTPEVRGLGERFRELREQIGAVAADLEEAGAGVGEIKEGFGRRLDELQAVLNEGIARWEADQSLMQERLTALRDGLRDQLAALGRQVEAAESGLWGRLRRKDAGVKLSPEAWEGLSARLEGIIGGLEAIIARKKE